MASSGGPREPSVDPRTSSVVPVPPTVEIPLGSLASYHGLLEVCPPGHLPKCVTRKLIYSSLSPPSTSASSIGSIRDLGRSPLPPYPVGTRLRFHFRTTVSHSGALLDDTRFGVRSKPMELTLGKGFILEIWEVALNTMKENDVVRFTVPKEMCFHYPTVAKVKRNLSKARKVVDSLTSTSYSGVGYSLEENGMTGYLDLDDFLMSPQNLTFTLELLEVSLPGEYVIPELYNARLSMQSADISNIFQDDSAMSVERKADKLLVSRDYLGAATMYSDALRRIDQLAPIEDMEEQQKKRISLLMKSAYCKMNSKNYTESLALLTSILAINSDNPVALFRRGRCNVQAGDFDQARKDFARALELDPTYQKAVKPELAIIEAEERSLHRINISEECLN